MSENAAVRLDIPGLPEVLSLYVHGAQDQYVSSAIRRDRIWEPFETSLVLEFLQAGSVFVDAGANIGYFSVLAGALVGESGRVFAFEPDPDNFRLLAANCALNRIEKRVELVAMGLASADRSARLYLSRDNLGDHQIYPGEASRDSVPVALLNGSDYLRPRLQRLDLLKVDTQGAEYEVLVGLMPLLQGLAKKPRIIIELTPYSLGEAGASGRRLVELLALLEQPFWIIDHIEHRLAHSCAEELALWCDNVDACTGDRGFMNILVGPGRPTLEAQ